MSYTFADNEMELIKALAGNAIGLTVAALPDRLNEIYVPHGYSVRNLFDLGNGHVSFRVTAGKSSYDLEIKGGASFPCEWI